MKVSDKSLTLIKEYDGWHVDIASRVELVFDPAVLAEPKNPIHSFAGAS